MQRYCSVKRIAFNELSPPRKHSVKYATHRLEETDSLVLNWRYCEHAARDADAEVSSQAGHPSIAMRVQRICAGSHLEGKAAQGRS
jgi:hypothetical protein